MNTHAVLRTQQLVKEFDGVVAVDHLDLEISPSQIFGLLGPNGSGKTTTIRTALGIYVPDGGTVSLLGCTDPRAVRTRIGYLPEERGLYPKMQVQEQLAFLASIRGLSLAESSRRAAQWLERMGLADRAKALTNDLSKGMQQKVQFAAAVIHEPELVVLDEPFTGLDPVNTRLLKELILEQRKRGCTVVLSSHRMEQVEAMCESIGLIHEGKLVLYGQLDEVKARHGNNTLAVEYEGQPGSLEDLPGVAAVSDSGRQARLRMQPDADTQLILRALLERVQVRRFAIEEPSIEEIFLEKVGGASADSSPLVLTQEGELVQEAV